MSKFNIMLKHDISEVVTLIKPSLSDILDALVIIKYMHKI